TGRGPRGSLPKSLPSIPRPIGYVWLARGTRVPHPQESHKPAPVSPNPQASADVLQFWQMAGPMRTALRHDDLIRVSIDYQVRVVSDDDHLRRISIRSRYLMCWWSSSTCQEPAPEVEKQQNYS